MDSPRREILVPGITDNDALERTIASIRGAIIGAFARIETMMDSIIIKTTFDEEYTEYMDILLPSGNLTMKTKLKLFELCVEKYKAKHGGDFSESIAQLKTIVDIRDNLAHKLLDTSPEGIKLFKDSDTFRLFVFKNGVFNSYITYSANMVDNNIKTIIKIQNQILKIFLTLGCTTFA